MTQRPNSIDLDSLAQTISETRWGFIDVPERVDVGVNKATWRIGDAWLSCVPTSLGDSVDRLRDLCAAVADKAGSEFTVPTFIPSTAGEHSVQEGKQVWWMTAHVAGRAPEPSSEADMAAVMTGLARLHTVLATLTTDLAVTDTDMVTLFEQGVLLGSDPQLGYTETDKDLLIKAEALVRERLAALAGEPSHLVHGDPSNPNLRVTEDGEPVLTGLLDWDHARVDLVLADLATVAQTVVFRSEAPDPLARLERILEEYAHAGGASFTVDDALVGLLMAKFESIAHHGARYLNDEGPLDLVTSQPGKIQAVIQLIDERTPTGG